MKKIIRRCNKVGCLASVFNYSMQEVKSITFKLLMLITSIPITGISISNLLRLASLTQPQIKTYQVACQKGQPELSVCTSLVCGVVLTTNLV